MSVREETSEQGPVYGQSPDVHLDQTVVYGPVNRPNDGADSSAVGGGDPPTNPLGAVDGDLAKPPLLKDVEDSNAATGACGLQNLGNTCYMNAGLQCLRSIPSLIRYFVEGTPPAFAPIPEERDRDRLLVCKGHMANRFAVLLQKLWSCRYSSVRPGALKKTLGVRWNHFSDNRQHDCQEFMAVFLDSLHDDLQGDVEGADRDRMEVEPLTNGSNDNDISSNPDTSSSHGNASISTSVVTDSFRGTLKSEVVCNTCNFSSVKEEPFFFLSVPLPHACERQIEVTWVPVCTPVEFRRAVRVLVTVMNYATIGDLKKSLISTAGLSVQSDLVLMAEVKDCAVVRVMMDSLLLKNLNDTDNMVYAFEMASLGQLSPPQSVTEPNHDVNILQAGAPPLAADAPPPADAPPLPADAPPPPADAPPPPADAPPMPAGVMSVVMEWHSCGICLEEMVDTDLLIHRECGAVLCAVCLIASSQHSAQGGDHILCPICTMLVKPSEAFVPLATPSKDVVVRLLQTNIMFRSDNGFARPTVFGHPAILNLPSSGLGESLYTTVGVLVPHPLTEYEWTLNLTDSKGLFCSRCTFQNGCKGCEVANASFSMDLKPGDHLSITFHHLRQETMKEASEVQPHPSLGLKRLYQATLDECLAAFTQREVLFWFCPQCKCDREATKVLFPCTYPKTLIVHLKRFLYHNSGVKVEMPVLFPSTLAAGGKFLQLVGCVCHFGSLNCGHYTAFSLNPVTKEWYYYNDETVTKEAPSDKDAQSVYLLFYSEEQELPSSLPKPNQVVFNDEEEASIVEQLVNYLQPPPQASVPPPQAASQQDNSILGDKCAAGTSDASSSGPHQNGDAFPTENMNMETTAVQPAV
ncbi:hypothetical protein EMCRGX_G026127 [Ephydatia muelleri]